MQWGGRTNIYVDDDPAGRGPPADQPLARVPRGNKAQVNDNKRKTVTARSIRRDLLKNAQLNVDVDAPGHIHIEYPGDVGHEEETTIFDVSGFNEPKERTLTQDIHLAFYVSKDTTYLLGMEPTGLVEDDVSNSSNKPVVPHLRSLDTTGSILSDEIPVELFVVLPRQNNRNPYDFNSIIPQAGQTIDFSLSRSPSTRWNGVVQESTYLGTRHAGRRIVLLKISQPTATKI